MRWRRQAGGHTSRRLQAILAGYRQWVRVSQLAAQAQAPGSRGRRARFDIHEGRPVECQGAGGRHPHSGVQCKFHGGMVRRLANHCQVALCSGVRVSLLRNHCSRTGSSSPRPPFSVRGDGGAPWRVKRGGTAVVGTSMTSGCPVCWHAMVLLTDAVGAGRRSEDRRVAAGTWCPDGNRAIG